MVWRVGMVALVEEYASNPSGSGVKVFVGAPDSEVSLYSVYVTGGMDPSGGMD